jgi:hypothetical protein
MPEHSNILTIVADPEATMDGVVSASIGTVLLRLIEQYFPHALCAHDNPNQTLIEKEYTIFLSELQALNLEDIYGGERVTEEDIATITNAAEETINGLDKVKIYDGHSTQDYKFPLQLVIVLVWKALRDDAVYSELVDEGYRSLRMLSFINAIRRLRPGICHQGIRHELVLLLNGVYPGVSIIEDPQSFIIAKIKMYLEDRFWTEYRHANTKRKRQLLHTFKVWVKDNQCLPLFKSLDKGSRQLIADLERIFKEHGSDPNQLESRAELGPVSTCVKDYLQSGIPFNMDSSQCPILRDVRYILHMSEDSISALQSKIDQHFAEIISHPDDYRGIPQFVKLHEAYEHFRSYKQLLLSTKAMTQTSLAEWERRFEAELGAAIDCIFRKNPELPALEALYTIETIITSAHNEHMVAAVETFFETLQTGKKRAYDLLLEPHFQSFVTMTDDMVSMLEQQYRQDAWKSVTPYVVHLFILHAILHHDQRVRPGGWSMLFDNAFRAIVSHRVKSSPQYKFILPQIQYMFDARDKGTSLSRPKGMILLPSQVRTLEEWQTILSFVDATEVPKYYAPLAAYLNRLYHQAVNAGTARFEDAFYAIPAVHGINFIQLFSILSLITHISYPEFEVVYKILNPEDRRALSRGLVEKKDIRLFKDLSPQAIPILVREMASLENRATVLSQFPDIYTLCFEKLGAILAALTPPEYKAFFGRCQVKQFIYFYNNRHNISKHCNPMQREVLLLELQPGHIAPMRHSRDTLFAAPPSKRDREGGFQNRGGRRYGS